MFEPAPGPRVFAIPPGADFARAVVDGVLDRMGDRPPEALARVLLVVPTERMRRRLRALFGAGRAILLPRILLVGEITELVPDAPLPPAMPPLRRHLELARLIQPFLDSPSAPAPRSALFDLAESLAALIDEMHGEGVSFDRIRGLETGDTTGHWEASLGFLRIIGDYLEATGGLFHDAEARRRLALEHLVSRWSASPPSDPVLVVGSTGSRGTTFALMKAVAKLPQGAVILPGHDPCLPGEVWSRLTAPIDAGGPLPEDHPQFRFAAFAHALGIDPAAIPGWPADVPDEARNKVVSLALRPAPVTDQWRVEGRKLGDLRAATEAMTLIEAPQPRDEAAAIAVAMREAIETGQKAALITPDRTLGRRVAAALGRWNIVPDDSAGRPVSLTAPGRFLRQVAGMMGDEARAEDLVALLKHPLTRTGGGDRGPHLRFTREFELHLRRHSVVSPGPEALERFRAQSDDPQRAGWVDWVRETATELARPAPDRLGAVHSRLISLAEAIARGPDGAGSGALWEKRAGRDAKAACDTLALPAVADTPLALADYRTLLDRTLAGANTRDAEASRPDVMIWGTLEARVQGADLVILGGLNEGTWPARPDPDPWLNRQMRQAVGLLSPERRIGLSAHDFQQAVGARRVILTRSCRDEDAETIPARWLNRLAYLLDGLPDRGGRRALKEMRARGARLLAMAAGLDDPGARVPPAPRPAPAPPPEVRPKSYTVTEIEKLIRDPYAIYARYVLGLRRLRPLRPVPDAAARGEVFHRILETFIGHAPFSDADAAEALLLAVGESVLDDRVPWPAVRRLWRSHLAVVAPRIVNDELAFQAAGRMPLAREIPGRLALPDTPFVIRGKADRIDRLPDGRLVILDYKTGSVPTRKQIHHFQRQLLIEAVMAEHGAFAGIPPTEVAHVEHVSLARKGAVAPVALDREPPEFDFRTSTVQGELVKLLTHFDQRARGYVSRRAMEKVRFEGDFDHLARFGEWDETQEAETEVLP